MSEEESEVKVPEVLDVAPAAKKPVVVRSYPAKSKCRLCHGKGSLHHVETDTPKGQYRLGPCVCLIKMVKFATDGLGKDEELDFDVDKSENVVIVIKKKTIA